MLDEKDRQILDILTENSRLSCREMEKKSKLVWLILLALLASLFFSTTFILNRKMGMAGGHWVWSASLRYFYMLLFLSLWLALTKGLSSLTQILKVFREHWKFWLIAGTVGFGLFYAPLAFAASYAPGWVIASTWQLTILATLPILFLFRKKVPAKGILFSLLIFAGILLVNLEQASFSGSIALLLLGTLPVLLAVFAYPIGNQMVGEVKQGTSQIFPRITHPLMESAPARVLLMTIGSLPFWLLLIILVRPPLPSTGQLMNTALVALFSGVIATSLFWSARHRATKPYEIAAVDATQSGEVVFALFGEVFLLSGIWPHLMGIVGLLLVIFGLIAYVLSTSKAANNPKSQDIRNKHSNLPEISVNSRKIVPKDTT